MALKKYVRELLEQDTTKQLLVDLNDNAYMDDYKRAIRRELKKRNVKLKPKPKKTKKKILNSYESHIAKTKGYDGLLKYWEEDNLRRKGF